MEHVAAANNAFALGFFKKLSEDDPRKNLFFSPMSISAALTMVFQGAKGSTAAQMSKVLHVIHDKKSQPKVEKSKIPRGTEQQKVSSAWPPSVTSTYQQKLLEDPRVLSVNKTEEIHQGYQNLISEINKPGTKYVLKLANRLYGEASYDFLATFTDACEKFYHASLERCNFVKEPEGSRKHINTWVEETTAGKIKNLLPEGIIDSLTRLVLVNAIYFKGNWANQFLQDRTVERSFKINKNESKPVQMMYKKAKFNMTYISDYQTKILELPYVENELSMIILLPDEIQDNSTGLEKLEREITYEKLVDWTNPEMMDITEVELSLPKFKLEEKYDLKPVLSSMGMAEAFHQGKADFSGMSSGNDLVLSEVVHKSFIEVNEEGTEAAAATAAVMMLRCARIVPRFTADHPFLFFIRHNKTGTILFYGRFCSP
ncbi:serpin B6-like isoform X1 [Sphaerodactylus townsendi]|uniref:serpin B6-like isoform X1 n=1 Tax=Sphaerodactylus townsendi TaxID=933632 RepID=UPI002026BE5A|nr:serpin B6-like isoform X1 [Sphaerodactylus townsendi]XP_048363082.1 serpin B6-like isoform X1 [Sphaerodactylus townsendi]XP_048363085.1 serpin B6-like isoform X1 [Sphaerodactylus townsendi]